jgi:hypothetical protein
MNTKTKKIVAVSLIGLAGLGIGAVAGSQLFPEQIIKTETVTKEVPVEKIVEKVVQVPVEVVKEVKVEVPTPVDNGNLGKVLTFLEEQYDSEDVFSEADEIVGKIDMFNVYDDLAMKEVKGNLIEYMDDEGFLDSDFDGFRKSELSIKKVYDDFTHDANYDDGEIEFVYEVKVKAQDKDDDLDDVEVTYNVTVFVDEDGAEITDVEEVI